MAQALPSSPRAYFKLLGKILGRGGEISFQTSGKGEEGREGVVDEGEGGATQCTK